MLEKSYKFSDVAIQQKKCIVNSRSEIDIKSEIIKGVFENPLIAANMSTVVNSQFIIKLGKLHCLGIMHRAGEKSEILDEVKKISSHKNTGWSAASVGIGDDQFNFADKLIRAGAEIITIDVAHGWCNRVLELNHRIKHFYPQIKTIIGNVVNPDIINEIINTYTENYWPDAIKVGIGGGLGCSTATTAGCTMNQWIAVYNFSQRMKNLGVDIPIISDGNIRTPSDFVKAIGAGASGVMAGSIFASCPESAAKTKRVWFKKKKIYQGMASRPVQEKWRGKVNNDCPEGKTVLLDLGEPVENLLARYNGALRSGISYAGFNNIQDFQKGCEFIAI